MDPENVEKRLQNIPTAEPLQRLDRRVAATLGQSLTDTDSANRVTEVLASGQHRSHSHRMWRFAMRGTIAATLLIGLGTLFATLGDKEVRAEALLEEVIGTSQAFQGWIHISPDRIPDKIQFEGEPYCRSLTLHIQPAEKTVVKVMEFDDGGRHIEWRTSDTVTKYDSQTHTLTRHSLLDVEEDSGLQKGDMTPWQMSQGLFAAPTMDDVAGLIEQGCHIQVSKEGSYDRFDLTITEGNHANPSPFLTVLVDPETKLIHKWKCTIDGDEFLLTYTYNDPILNDIYDLGIDPGARVVDNRLDDEINVLLDLLDDKVDCFDNYLLVLTESRLAKDGTLDKPKTLEWPDENIAKFIWPGRHAIDFKHLPRITIALDVIRDDNRPGQKGLHVDQTGLKQLIGDDRVEWIYWLDETRDMVPVETIATYYTSNGTVSMRARTLYLTHDCMPSGHWYPSHWQTVFTVYQNGTPGKTRTTDYRLSVNSQ